MAFDRRREFLGIYSVKNANPNGDPLRGNEPRMDDETGKLLVSDVRIKRTIRDQWDREGKVVFVKVYEGGEAKSLKDRYLEPDIGGSQSDDREIAKDKLRKCIDVRLFGITFAPKGMDKAAFAWTGPVQISWGESLHKVSPQFVQGTAAFASDDSKSQRSLRTEWRVPYAMVAFYGVANQYASESTGATEDDLEALRDGWWKGTKNLITRSKLGHQPLMWFEIVYRNGSDALIGNLTNDVLLTDKDGNLLDSDAGQALRNHEDVVVDVSKLMKKIEARYLGEVEKVIVVKDATLNVKGLDILGDLVEVVEV